MKDNRLYRRILNGFVRYSLPLAMVLLTVATALLFYLEYRREEQRLVDSTQVAFSERLTSLELSIGKAVVSMTLATDWATNILSTNVPEMLYRQFSPNLFYTKAGDYFSIGPKVGLPGNVFGSGKPTDRAEHFAKEFGLSVGLLPWFRTAKKESDAIVQSYFVSETQICSAYPPIPPKVLLPLGGKNMAAAFGKFYEPHKGKQKNPDKQPYFLDPYVDRTGQGLVVTYAQPIYYGERFIGVVATDITLGFLQSFTEKIGGLNARLVLADEHGQILTDSESINNDIEILKDRLPEQLSNLWQDLVQGNAPGRIGNYYVAAQRLQNAPWTFIQIIDSRMLSKRLLLSKITFSIGLLVLIAFLSVAYFAIRRRRLEGDLRESELRYREVYDATEDAIIIYDHAVGRILDVNRAFEEMFGFSRDEVSGIQIADLSAGELPYTQAEAEKIIQRSIAEGPKTFEWRSRRKDETLFWIEVSLRSSIIGGLHRSIAVVRDITDRKRAEDELHEKQETINAIVETSQDWIWSIDRNGIHTYSNPAAESILGLSAHKIIGKSLWDRLHPEDREYIGARWQKWIGEKIGWNNVIFRWRHIKGTYRYLESTSVPIFNSEGAFLGFRGVDRDITERMRSEQALAESEDKFRSLVETSADVIWEMDLKGRYTYISPRVRDLLGYLPNEVIGRSPIDFVIDDDKEQLANRFARISENPRPFYNLVNTVVHKNGGVVILETSGAPRLDADGNIKGFRGVDRDITERKNAEAEKKRLESLLHQAQKMEAIGTLAGGIAHDFNNILGAIIGYAELAEMEISDGKARGYLKQLQLASNRAKNLVGQILAFSRQDKYEKVPTDISIIIKEALKLLKTSLPANIELHQKFEKNLDTIMADQTQIHQVIMNLCANALHAVGKTAGLIEVSLSQMSFDDGDTSYITDLAPGRYLKLTVTDTGQGMDKETLDRIFEPYFTTKEVGVGTGLGLAIVHGIVKEHGGAIKVNSKPGSGTSFHIYFPCVEDEVINQTEISGPLLPGIERILFVDDEKILLDIGETMLTKLGYKVDCRTSPYEALEAFKANPQKYDLVISDMSMPVMTGDKLSQEILQIRPNIPIIICTGFSNRINPETASKMGIKGFLMKPLTIVDLAKSIRDVLDKKLGKTNL